MSCQAQQYYTTTFNYDGDTSLINAITIPVVLVLQCSIMIVMMCVLFKASKKPSNKKQPFADKNDPVRLREGNDYDVEDQNPNPKEQKYAQAHQKGKGKSENSSTSFIQKLRNSIANISSKTKLKVFGVMSVVMVVISLVLLGLAILASEQALNYHYQKAQCTMNQTVSLFVDGQTDTWIGISYMVPNLTKLELNLNTRVKATQNAILALLLNGTGASFPIGFPLGTSISSQLTGTTIVTTNVETYIDATLRQWLIRNSSLSGSYEFPICQTSTISNIPHPLNDGQTIQLDYMDSICANLTEETDLLVENGRAVDSLLTLAQSVQTNKPDINANLSQYNSTITQISLRSSEYSSQFSSLSLDVGFARALPLVLFFLVLLFSVFMCIFYCVQGFRIDKHRYEGEDSKRISYQGEGQESGMRVYPQAINPPVSRNNAAVMDEFMGNMSVSDESELTPSEMQVKRHAKLRKILRNGVLLHKKVSGALIGSGCPISILIILSTLFYTSYVNTGVSYCNKFASAKNGETNLNSIEELSSTQRQLLAPIQQCTSGSNEYFLQTQDTTTHRSNIQSLYQISLLYNSSTPTDVLNSTSLNQIQILKEYLLHMETMPIKSQDFSILSILSQLNTYTNGTNANSQQQSECGSSVVRDQYVYNTVDCDFNMMQYNTEQTTSDPRCLQIPTYDASAGTNQADLNDAQHTIELNGTCTTMSDFFDGTNSGCFLGKRLALLTAAGCTSTASEYNRRINNLLDFSIEAASYTNAYMQNLRNYFGFYALLSTNLTDFFNGANMSETLNQFGVFSHNLLNLTACSYLQSAVDTIQGQYCSSSNSITMLLFDSYVWVYLAYFFIAIALIFLFCVDTMMRVQYVQKSEYLGGLQRLFEVQANRPYHKKKHIMQEYQKQKSSAKKMQLSEQTLRNEDIDEPHMERVQIVREAENIFALQNKQADYEAADEAQADGSYDYVERMTKPNPNTKSKQQTNELKMQDDEKKEQLDGYLDEDIVEKGMKNDAVSRQKIEGIHHRNTYSEQQMRKIKNMKIRTPDGHKIGPFFDDSSNPQSEAATRMGPADYIKNKGRLSKQQIRSEKRENESKTRQRPPKPEKQIAKVSKSGQENQRLKVIEVGSILTDNIDLMMLQGSKQEKPLHEAKKQQESQ